MAVVHLKLYQRLLRRSDWSGIFSSQLRVYIVSYKSILKTPLVAEHILIIKHLCNMSFLLETDKWSNRCSCVSACAVVKCWSCDTFVLFTAAIPNGCSV